jgi:hypothetical protein
MSDIEDYNRINGAAGLVLVNLPKYDYIPKISKSDLDKGYITRYFAQRSNSKSSEIRELSKADYNFIRLSNLHTTVEMEWRISGKKEDEFKGNLRTYIGVESSNRASLERAMQVLPGLKFKIRNMLQFYREF